MRAPLLRVPVLLALAALFLGQAGCGAMTGTSAPASFYVLTPTQGAGPAPAVVASTGGKLLLVIGPVSVAPYLDRPQIVTRGQGVRVSLAEFDRWAEPLDKNLARVLAEDVARLTAASVLVVPAWDEDKAEARVLVDVERLDGALGGEATLVAWWSLRTHDGQTLSRVRTEHQGSAGSSFASLVEAQSALVGRLAQDIAAAVNSLAASGKVGR